MVRVRIQSWQGEAAPVWRRRTSIGTHGDGRGVGVGNLAMLIWLVGLIRVVLSVRLVVGQLWRGREGYRGALVGCRAMESRIVEGRVGFVVGRELLPVWVGERLHNARPAPGTAKMRIGGWWPRMRELRACRVETLVHLVHIEVMLSQHPISTQPPLLLVVLILQPCSVGRVHRVVMGGVMRGMRVRVRV